MNGVHDLGGMHGFGAVEVEPDEPVFHERWEGRVFGMLGQVMAHGLFSIDAFRHAIERMVPAHYLRSSYYERWRASLETLLDEGGVLGEAEIRARIRALREDRAGVEARVAAAEPRPMGSGAPDFLRSLERAPRFAVGDRVRARNEHPAGHTRLPRYARGRRGRVVMVRQPCVFPDTNAHGRGEDPQHLYHVRFEGRELWGDGAEAGLSVGLDLFEPYLEPA